MIIDTVVTDCQGVVMLKVISVFNMFVDLCKTIKANSTLLLSLFFSLPLSSSAMVRPALSRGRDAGRGSCDKVGLSGVVFGNNPSIAGNIAGTIMRDSRRSRSNSRFLYAKGHSVHHRFPSVGAE